MQVGMWPWYNLMTVCLKLSYNLTKFWLYNGRKLRHLQGSIITFKMKLWRLNSHPKLIVGNGNLDNNQILHLHFPSCYGNFYFLFFRIPISGTMCEAFKSIFPYGAILFLCVRFYSLCSWIYDVLQVRFELPKRLIYRNRGSTLYCVIRVRHFSKLIFYYFSIECMCRYNSILKYKYIKKCITLQRKIHVFSSYIPLYKLYKKCIRNLNILSPAIESYI
jgi:hypothetical protein